MDWSGGFPNTEDEVNITKGLAVLSHPKRWELFRYIHEKKGNVTFKTLLSELFTEDNKPKTSSLSNHLKKMIDAGLIYKENGAYSLTPLGNDVADSLFKLEKVFLQHSGRHTVRTASYSIERFNVKKIADFLVKKLGIEYKTASNLAEIVKTRILTKKYDFITTSLVKNVITSVLLEHGYTDYLRNIQEFGMSAEEMSSRIRSRDFGDISDYFRHLGSCVFNRYMMFYALPEGLSDEYFTGKIYFEHPQFWGIAPAEVILPHKSFANYVVSYYKKFISRYNRHPNDRIKYRCLSDAFRYSFSDLGEFFYRGAVIFDIAGALLDICSKTETEVGEVIDIFFEEYAFYSASHARSSKHHPDWDLCIYLKVPRTPECIMEVLEGTDNPENLTLNGRDVIFGLILEKYYSDVLGLRNRLGDHKDAVSFIEHIIMTRPRLVLDIGAYVKSYSEGKYNLDRHRAFCIKVIMPVYFHNVIVVNGDDSGRPSFKTLSPLMVPVTFEPETFGVASLDPRPQVVLDKIFIDLVRVLEDSECINIDSDVYGTSDDDRKPFKDKKRFIERLRDYLSIALNMFDLKFVMLKRYMGSFKNWPKVSEKLFGKDFLKEQEDLIDYASVVKIICPISLIGLAETVRYYTGFIPGQTSEATEFFFEIIETAAGILKSNSKHPHVEYILCELHFDNYLQEIFFRDLEILEYISNEFINLKLGDNTPIYEYARRYLRQNVKKDTVVAANTIIPYMDTHIKHTLKEILPYLPVFYIRPFKIPNKKWYSMISRYREKTGTCFMYTPFIDCADMLASGIADEDIIAPELVKRISDKIKELFAYGIRFIAVSNIIGSGTNAVYKYAGKYRRVSGYGRLLQNALIKHKDSAIGGKRSEK